MRAKAVRALLGRTAPSDRDAIVRLSFGGHRVPPPDRGPDDSAGELQIWHDDQALALAYGPLVGARVESGRAMLGDCERHEPVRWRHHCAFRDVFRIAYELYVVRLREHGPWLSRHIKYAWGREVQRATQPPWPCQVELPAS